VLAEVIGVSDVMVMSGWIVLVLPNVFRIGNPDSADKHRRRQKNRKPSHLSFLPSQNAYRPSCHYGLEASRFQGHWHCLSLIKAAWLFQATKLKLASIEGKRAA
jgi:hypothetical protein